MLVSKETMTKFLDDRWKHKYKWFYRTFNKSDNFGLQKNDIFFISADEKSLNVHVLIYDLSSVDDISFEWI
jgi:hypothetical protein